MLRPGAIDSPVGTPFRSAVLVVMIFGDRPDRTDLIKALPPFGPSNGPRL